MSAHATAARPGESLAGGGGSRVLSLATHLARREVASDSRYTLLGWTWPVLRQLAQLAVLVFVFGSVLELGIENYPVFVFCGLVAWGWFSAGVGRAASSIVAGRHLVNQPRFPVEVLPAVAVAVPLVDVLVALPVLLAMAAWAGSLSPSALFLPVLLALQLPLMLGIGWITAAITVYLRDVAQVVGVGLTMAFYLTPVFYDRRTSVPEEYQGLLQLNPMTVIIEGWRAVLLDGRLPSFAGLAVLAVVGLGLAGAGWVLIGRLRGGFVDEL